MQKISQCSDCHEKVALHKLDDHLNNCLGYPESSTLDVTENIPVPAHPRRSSRRISLPTGGIPSYLESKEFSTQNISLEDCIIRKRGRKRKLFRTEVHNGTRERRRVGNDSSTPLLEISDDPEGISRTITDDSTILQAYQEVIPETSVAEPILKRKRGRPRKLKAKADLSAKTKSNSPKFVELGNIECGKCDNVGFTLKSFKKHVTAKHCGFARPKGQSQEFSKEEGLDIISDHFSQAKRWTCQVCQKIFISKGGAHYHYKNCGINKEDRVQLCRFCHQMIPLSQYQTHRAYHNEKRDPDFSNNNILARRDSLRKRSNLSFKEPNSDDDDRDSCEEKPEISSNFVVLTKKYANRAMIKKWQFQLDTSDCCYCPYKGCGESFSTEKLAVQHIESGCDYEPNVFKCVHCNFKSENNDQVVDHILSNPDGMCSKTKRSSHTSKPRIGLRTDEFLDQTKKFRQANYSTEFMSDLVFDPDYWQRLSHEEMYNYSPKLKESPLTQVHMADISLSNRWTTLALFGSLMSTTGPILFTGGPIVASSWCPLPDDNSGLQYLALSIDLDPDKKNVPSTKGMIQIWKFDEKAVEIAAILIFDYGRVNAIEWCPSGGYLESDSGTSRLGILAAACSDGSVRIFVIPDSLQHGNGKWYRVCASLSLLCCNWTPFKSSCSKLVWHSGEGHRFIVAGNSDGSIEKYDIATSCEFLKFTGSSQFSIIHPVMKTIAHEGARITALSVSPHGHGDHIFTGGSDRWGKFWNLLDPSCPEEAFRKSIPLDSQWSIHWKGCFVSYDDMGFHSKNTTTFKPCNLSSKLGFPVLYSNTAVWSISFSQWLNAICQVEEAGNATITFLRDLSCHEGTDKYIARTQFPVATISTEYLDSENVLERQIDISRQISDSKRGKLLSGQELKQMTVDSYEEIAKRSRVIISEYPPDVFHKTFSKNHTVESDAEFCSRIRQHYISQSKCISWNNNLEGRNLIFLGSNSGVGKIISLTLPIYVNSRRLK